jgi:hypothetical protein
MTDLGERGDRGEGGGGDTAASASEMTSNARPASETIGTGSYIGISCAVLMGLLTLILIAGLLISRWLG